MVMTSNSQLVQKVYDECVRLFKRSDGAEESTLVSASRGRETVYTLQIRLADGSVASLHCYSKSPKMFKLRLEDESSNVSISPVRKCDPEQLVDLERASRLLERALPYPWNYPIYWYYEGGAPVALVNYQKDKKGIPQIVVALPGYIKVIPAALRRMDLQAFWRERDKGNIRPSQAACIAMQEETTALIWCGGGRSDPSATVFFNWGFPPYKRPRRIPSKADQEDLIESAKRTLIITPSNLPPMGKPFN